MDRIVVGQRAAARCLIAALAALPLAAQAAHAARPGRVQYEASGSTVVYYVDDRLAYVAGGALLEAPGLALRADAMQLDARAAAITAAGNVVVRCAAGVARFERVRIDVTHARADAAGSDAPDSAHPFDLATCALGDGAARPRIEPVVRSASLSAIRARRIEIVFGSFVRLVHAKLGLGRGAVTVPAYSIELGQGRAYAPPAPGVAVDGVLGVGAADSSIADARLRIDPRSGVGVGFTERLVSSQNQYVAAEASTAGIGARLDILQGYEITPHFRESLTLDAFRDFRGGRFGLDADTGPLLFTQSLVQSDAYQIGDLAVGTKTTRFGGYGDVHGWIDFEFVRSPGATVPFYTLGSAGAVLLFDRIAHVGFVEPSFALDARATAFGDGERKVVADVSASFGERITKRLHLTESATITKSYDTVADAIDGLAEPPAYSAPESDPLYTPLGTGTNDTGILRSFSVTANYDPSRSFGFALSLAFARDTVANGGTVRPPTSGWFYLHALTPSNFGFQFGRSYLFGWNGVRFTPNYTLQVQTPQ